ncbi:hypothetical protein RHPLAN_28970 [Rhodoplanes sp. Z2-YC6860]|nr:hypothetical protein [Rhodoplanes sp. Z2-YC6860]AMN41334.1 hypothetical protein RHPLAN_28970 [Rhodoplanes sp. Z2-YC6860]
MGIRSYFKGGQLARMSNGTYCIIRDLGLVKGGKGLRHHECLLRIPSVLSSLVAAVWPRRLRSELAQASNPVSRQACL